MSRRWAVVYQPDPELSAWYRREKALKKHTAPKAQRPPKPAPNPEYPTKQHLALRLLEDCKANHPDIRVHCITADALYGTAPFVESLTVPRIEAVKVCPQRQAGSKTADSAERRSIAPPNQGVARIPNPIGGSIHPQHS